jgi:cytochrome c-type biogenesis protein CcmE
LIKRRLIVVFCILACVVGFLLYKGLTSAIVYFKTANQAVADRASLGNSTFQIEGLVVPGSVRRTGPSSLDFAISSNNIVVRVENQGSPPSLFQADIPVVLVGHFLGASDVFSSDEILIKHSNQYIAAHPNRVRAPNGSIH